MISTILALLLACNPPTENSNSTVGTMAKEGLEQTMSSANAAPLTTPSTDGTAVVATWNGGTLTYAQGVETVKGQLIQMEAEYLMNKYQTAKSGIEQSVLQTIIDEEVKKGGYASQEALFKVEVEDKITPPNDAEINLLYVQFQSRLQGMSLEEAKPLLAGQAVRQKQGERFQVYLEELKSKYNVQITLPYPEVPRQKVSADDDPFLGTDNAPIEIIQFAEFQCPYCGKVGDTIDKILETYPGKVKIVFRDFPLGFHDRAIPAAVAANCAGEQGKYWEMHKVLMANQTALQESDLSKYAVNLELDITKWNSCRQNPAQDAEVRKDMADATEVGVTGTPAFFINGILLSGAIPFSEFQQLIDKELAQK